jgi:hypothetical protein
MVERMREKPGGEEVEIVLGDMAEVGTGRTYGLVYLVYNTIGNLLTQAEQVQCFRNAAAHLSAGGRFVIELTVPALRALPPGSNAAVFASAPGYIGVDTYDVVNQLLTSNHFTFGEGRHARVGRSPHRYVWPAELDLMGELAGFELESRHADWTGAELTPDSSSHVSVYRLGGTPDVADSHI